MSFVRKKRPAGRARTRTTELVLDEKPLEEQEDRVEAAGVDTPAPLSTPELLARKAKRKKKKRGSAVSTLSFGEDELVDADSPAVALKKSRQSKMFAQRMAEETRREQEEAEARARADLASAHSSAYSSEAMAQLRRA